MTITLNGTTGITTPEITTDSGESLTSRVAKTGDTMTGNLIVDAQLGVGTTTHYDDSTKLTVAGRINTSNGTAIGSMNYGGGSVVNMGSLSNHPLQLMTNNTTRMVIDSAGRVTMPYQPAFTAYLTSTVALNSGSWVLLTGNQWATERNNGDNFNAANGTFTAPVAGFYCFVGAVHFGSNSGGTYRYVGYRKNGSDRYVSSVHAASANWSQDNTLSYSFAEYLSANDSIFMMAYVDVGSMEAGSGLARTRFSGYLIG